MQVQIPFHLFPNVLQALLLSVEAASESDNEFLEKLVKINNDLIKLITYWVPDLDFSLQEFEQVLQDALNYPKERILKIVLAWVNCLITKFNADIFSNIKGLITSLTKKIDIKNKELFNSCIDILCVFACLKQEFMEIVIKNILIKICSNQKLLNLSGVDIICRLAQKLEPEQLFRIIVEISGRFNSKFMI